MIHRFIKSKSRIATIMVGFNAGSRNEEKNRYSLGISHMLEHCFFKGTKNRNWEKLLDDVAYLGGSANAYTSYGKVAYMISVPVENIDPATEIIHDMIANMDLSEEEFQKEKQVVMEEMISTSDSTGNFIWQNLSEEFFDNHLKSPIIGTEETISNFTREEVLKYYKEFCGLDQAIVVISGDMKKKDAMATMQSYFGKPNGRIKRPKFKKSNLPETKKIEITKPGIESVSVRVCVPGRIESEKDEIVAEVMNSYFGGGMNSKLFKEVREKKGLVYSVGSGLTNFSGNGSIQSIYLSTREENVEEAIDTVNEQIELLTESLVSEHDLIRVKNQIKSSFYSFIECSSSLCSYEIDRIINRACSVDDHIKMIEEVTPQDILDFAKKVYNKENVVVLICKGEDDEHQDD